MAAGQVELHEKARLLRETLAKSQATTESMVTILGSFDDRLSALEAAMRPTQVRTHTFRKAYENIEGALRACQAVLEQYDVSRQVEDKLVAGPANDIDGYLAAVDRLQAAVEFFSSHRSFKSADAALTHATGLLQKAMGRLEEALRKLLTGTSKPLDPKKLVESVPKREGSSVSQSGGDEGSVSRRRSGDPRASAAALPALMSTSAVPKAHDMVVRMTGGGWDTQASRAYRDVRVNVVRGVLRKLGAEETGREELGRLPWETLERKIGAWVQYVRVAVILLFPAECKLCDAVMYGLPVRDRTFLDVVHPTADALLGFGDAIVRSKRSPEKLFVLLEMYEAVRDALPHLNMTFEGRDSGGLVEQMAALRSRLAVAARETFSEFEIAVENDSHKSFVIDGAVHPLTSYTINYVKFLYDYQKTIKELGEEEAIKDKEDMQNLGAAVTRIMQVLLSNLDAKSKLYKDAALTQVFMMNNVHYMVRSFKKADAKELLGDDWVQRQRRIVQQYATGYQRTAWGKVLQFLSGQGLGGTGTVSVGTGLNPTDTGGVSRTVLKERFKNFNLAFEDLHSRQTAWSISDGELREAVRLSVAEVLLPAYRSFLKRYSTYLESGKHPDKYIKYKPEDLERLLGDFFEGKPQKAEAPQRSK